MCRGKIKLSEKCFAAAARISARPLSIFSGFGAESLGLSEYAHEHRGGEQKAARRDIVNGENADQAEQQQGCARKEIAFPALFRKAEFQPVFDAALHAAAHNVIFGQFVGIFQERIYLSGVHLAYAEGERQRVRLFGECRCHDRHIAAALPDDGGEFVRRGGFEAEQRVIYLVFYGNAPVFYARVLAAFGGERFGDAPDVVFGRVDGEVEGKLLYFQFVLPRGIPLFVPFSDEKVQKECERGRRSERAQERCPKRGDIKTEYAEKKEECRPERKGGVRPERKIESLHAVCPFRFPPGKFIARAGRGTAVLILSVFSLF